MRERNIKAALPMTFNGNQTGVTKGSETESYVYDSKNRLVSSGINGTENTYSYYPGGLRKTKDGAAYIYDGKNILAEITDENIRLNVYGNALLFTVEGTVTVDSEEISVSGKIAYAYGFNLHGDVVRVLSVAGLTLNTYKYDAFGVIVEQTEAVANTFYYSGYEYDSETGLYYLRSRYYNPETARFLTEDSFSGYYNDPLSLNKYTYCHNNPVSYHDPDGEFIINWLGGLIGGVVGGLIGGGVDLVGQLVSGTSWDDLNWKSVGASAAEGAIVGAVAGFTAGNPLAMGVASAAGNAVKQGINKGFDNIDVGEVVVSGTVGLVSAGAGKVASKAITKISSTTINKAAKVTLSALTEGTIEAGLDLGRQGIEIAAGKRESIDLVQTVTSFGMGMITGGFQAEAEIKAQNKIKTIEPKTFNKKEIDSMRKKGVDLAWKNEKQQVLDGTSRYNWLPDEMDELISNGKVKGYVGHHVKTVKDSILNNSIDDILDSSNIAFIPQDKHLYVHNGNWKNSTLIESLNEVLGFKWGK